MIKNDHIFHSIYYLSLKFLNEFMASSLLSSVSSIHHDVQFVCFIGKIGFVLGRSDVGIYKWLPQQVLGPLRISSQLHPLGQIWSLLAL